MSTLLWQSESETLDFKRDQYPFDSGTDDDRSELLKDILAFANAWRTSDAHILIGVQEVKGSRAAVTGAQHLLNRTLQTFVQSKVNRPITFFYEPVDFEGKSIGVVTIPVQDRPFFLTKNFGRLKSETVYIRRGDITSTASPDEVAQMGAKLESGRAQPVLEFAFADLEKRSKLESHPVFRMLCLDVPEDAEIPGYGNNYGLVVRINDENEDFYSDLAVYLRDVAHMQALGVTVANTSRVNAQQVVVRLGFEQPDVEVKSSGGRAAEPVKERLMKMMRSDAFMRSDVSVIPHERGIEVQIE
ncbi:MAG TPA: ATP-binding protein [Edaphobacter sp.]|nr:ATP-binding protein [Edaphobacter sp.]